MIQFNPWRDTGHCQGYGRAGRERDEQDPGGSQRARKLEDAVHGGQPQALSRAEEGRESCMAGAECVWVHACARTCSQTRVRACNWRISSMLSFRVKLQRPLSLKEEFLTP